MLVTRSALKALHPQRRRWLEWGAATLLLLTIVLPGGLLLRTWYLNRQLVQAIDNRKGSAAVLAWVRQGASVHTRGNNRETPLHIASDCGSPSDVLYLIQRGADVEDRGYLSTPLMCAARVGRLDNVRLLLAHGGDANQVSDSPSLGGDSPLWAAASANRSEIIRVLVAAGADVNLPTRRGGTPLAAAAHYQRLEAMRVLLALGADVNRPSSTGVTPLMRTVWMGRHRAARLLLEHGAQVNARDAQGRTALGLLFEEQGTYLTNWGKNDLPPVYVRHLAEDYRTTLRLLLRYGARE